MSASIHFGSTVGTSTPIIANMEQIYDSSAYDVQKSAYIRTPAPVLDSAGWRVIVSEDSTFSRQKRELDSLRGESIEEDGVTREEKVNWIQDIMRKGYKWVEFGCSDRYMREQLLLKKEVRESVWQKWRSQNPSDPLLVPQIVIACYLLFEKGFTPSEVLALKKCAIEYKGHKVPIELWPRRPDVLRKCLAPIPNSISWKRATKNALNDMMLSGNTNEVDVFDRSNRTQRNQVSTFNHLQQPLARPPTVPEVRKVFNARNSGDPTHVRREVDQEDLGVLEDSYLRSSRRRPDEDHEGTASESHSRRDRSASSTDSLPSHRASLRHSLSNRISKSRNFTDGTRMGRFSNVNSRRCYGPGREVVCHAARRASIHEPSRNDEWCNNYLEERNHQDGSILSQTVDPMGLFAITHLDFLRSSSKCSSMVRVTHDSVRSDPSWSGPVGRTKIKELFKAVQTLKGVTIRKGSISQSAFISLSEELKRIAKDLDNHDISLGKHPYTDRAFAFLRWCGWEEFNPQ